LHVVAVWIIVIEGQGEAVADWSRWQYAIALQTLVRVDKLSKVPPRVRNVQHTRSSARSRCILGFTRSQVQERHSVMFVIVSKKAQSVVTMLYPGLEHFYIPLDHLIVPMRLIYDVAKSARRCHGNLLGAAFGSIYRSMDFRGSAEEPGLTPLSCRGHLR